MNRLFVLLLTTTAVTLACRSNQTHIAWRQNEDCQYETLSDAQRQAWQFLYENIMSFDRPKQETMGFVRDDNDADGLDNGLIGPTIQLALQTKIDFEYTDVLSKSLFYDYVLNYAHTNEARTNWRPLLHSILYTRLQQQASKHSIEQVVEWVNAHLWNWTSISFEPSQTPLIFDPMSVLAFGYASCTGCAIVFACALRTVGVPARIAGTPAWLNNRTRGNHNWVEVWDHTEWRFLEPTTNAGAVVDTLQRDPCERWFCNSKLVGHTQTRTFAPALNQRRNTTYYPLAWEWNCHDVPGYERTDYYHRVCGNCPQLQTDTF